ncbi:MAG: prepilin-type N-terminal cleavage/methylation domain-containing protein [Solirubrobacteraceae bacterium]
MTRDNRQAGFALTELLVVMMIGSLLLGATLFTFARFVTNSNTNDARNDSVEQARRALDVEARQLRSLAKRRPDSTVAVLDTVTADDLIFQTSDSNRTWVRYCLNTSDPANGTLYQQTQTLSVAAAATPITPAMRSGCPSVGGAWDRTVNVATNVVNRVGGRNQPLFSYRCAGGGTACTASTAAFDAIIGVNSQLFIDTTPAREPAEERVQTGVFLRNQNQAPVAAFTATALTGSPRTVLLNASGSTDYEQRTLTYYWFMGTLPPAASIRCDQPGDLSATSLWGGTLIGRGVSLQYTWPGTSPASGTGQTVGVVACDPGFRSSGLVTQTVIIPS